MLEVAGLQWSLRFDAPSDYLSGLQVWAPWGVLAIGVWITALTASYLRMLFDRTAQVEREVEARTVELSLANLELQEREAQARSSTEYLSALQETTLGLVSRLELKDLLETIVVRAADLLGTSHGYVYLVKPGTEEMIMQVGVGIHSPFVGSPLKPGEGLGGQIWLTNQPLIVNDYRNWPARLTDSRSESIQAMMGEPLRSGAEVVGVIAVSYVEEGRTISPSQAAILHRFAQLASVALDNARLYTALQQELAERSQAQAELERAKEAAVAANRAKSTFLANMSHELRTPLNAIIGYSEMLLEEVADSGRDDFTDDLEKIGSAGRHLLSLISDILDLSKIEAGKVELHLEPIDVAHLVQEVTTTVQPLMARNANTFQVVTDGELAVPGPELGIMYADLTKVRQVLLNLLSNAAKFTAHGTVTLMISRVQSAAPPGLVATALGEGQQPAVSPGPVDWMIFSVRDTGIGISPEHMGRLFHAFTQADASTTRKYGGTGLGLAISYHFCQLMGGSIDVESAPGRGAIFTVHLPAQVAMPQLSSAKVRVDGLNSDATSDI
ncbi:MAG: GAF domain-containing sensor histidine kinase [Anaerolineae bacterium]|nr:GAF domain-containing sensor histidine kinase [Anaerolineae bacterium]